MCHGRHLLRLTVPVRTWSMANTRWHWAKKARIARWQRRTTKRIVAETITGKLRLPLRITMTRQGPRRLDDDNLAVALKHVRDGVADALGVDDGDRRLAWRCRQERCREYAVRIEIEPGDG